MNEHNSILKISALSFFLLLTTTTALGQAKQKISVNFNAIPFKQFIDSIESRTPFYFYYDARALDTLQITIQAEELTLAEILQKAFDNTSFYFQLDDANHVFITSQLPVQTKLPAHFFDKTVPVNDSISPFAVAFQKPTTSQKLESNTNIKLIELGNRTHALKGKANISGYIRHTVTGQALAGATVYIDSLSISTLTNQFGYFIITVPTGALTLKVSSVGMQDESYALQVNDDGKLDIQMQDYITSLKTVVVLSDRNTNTKSLNMGLNRLQMPYIKKVPVVFGETDILRVIQTLPGVTSAGEASTGFHVRGGASDQNLILFSDATIYNPSHLFGFFSAFNPDVVKGVELYKSGIPQKFGGRLSSVMDVATKEGNGSKLSGAGGIGLLTSRLTLEGPLKKEKTTFVIAGRMNYSNWLLKKVTNDNYKNSQASFYDGNLHVNHSINAKNNIYLTGYISHDQFQLNMDTLYNYVNKNINLKWKHIYNKRMTGVTTTGFDVYQYALSSDQNRVNAFDLSYKIQQVHFRSDYNYTVNNKHQLNFGIHSIYYKLQSGSYQPKGLQSLVKHDVLQPEKALESALYLGDAFTVSPKLAINAGLRFSLFNYLGPKSVYQYLKYLPRQGSHYNGYR